MTTNKRGRGRGAGRPRRITKSGWRDVLLRVKERLTRDNLSIIAAGVAFYGMFALFPALAALVSIYALVADPAAIQSQLEAMRGVMPEEVQTILARQLQDITGQSGGALGAGVVAGILVALWSAAKGVKALFVALNIAYQEEESRGFLKLNGMALLLTLAAIIFIIVSLGLIAILPLLLGSLGLPSTIESLVVLARWPLLGFLVMLALAVLYRYGPDREQPQWRWVSWGAFIATLLWLLGSILFSFYAANFGGYNETYGALAAVIILLFWLYLTAYVILLGAEFNAETERQTRRDTTDEKNKPLGERDAHAADTVGSSPGREEGGR